MCFFSNAQQEDEFAPRGHLARKRTDSWAMIRGKTIDLKSWSVTTEKKIEENGQKPLQLQNDYTDSEVVMYQGALHDQLRYQSQVQNLKHSVSNEQAWIYHKQHMDTGIMQSKYLGYPKRQKRLRTGSQI